MSRLQADSNKTDCDMTIANVAKRISIKFPQYPQFGNKLKIHCAQEAFDEIDILIDDVSDGFDESVLLEAIGDDIQIKDDDKEPICQTLHYLLTNYGSSTNLQPISLNLAKLDSDFSENDVKSMKQMVCSQISLLNVNYEDLSIFHVLIIGKKNRFPLLSYLVDTFHRYRLSKCYKNWKKVNYKVLKYEDSSKRRRAKQERKYMFKDVELNHFYQEYLNKNNIDKLYQQAMKTYIDHLSWTLPLIPTKIHYKMKDSLFVYTTYYISILKSVNNLIKNSCIHFPAQIDIWIIPKKVEIHEDVDCDEKSSMYKLNLIHTQNLRTVDIAANQQNIDNLSNLFRTILMSTFNQQTHKRMVTIIDRRCNDDNDNGDVLHSYLPKNTQNIRKGDEYLNESMINLSKIEVVPSKNGCLNDDDIINTNSNIPNMFLLSLHIDKEDQVSMYWHYGGFCTRFFIEDMYNLWPLYFNDPNINDYISDPVNYNNYISKLADLVQTNIYDGSFDELYDVNFTKFYEINTGLPFNATIPKMRKTDLSSTGFYNLQELVRSDSTKSTVSEPFIDSDIKIDDENKSFDIESNIIKEPIENSKCIELIYKSDFDKNGLLYWLGTNGKSTTYTNPAQIGMVKVNVSSLASDSQNMHIFVGRECKRLITRNEEPSWISINLNNIKIKVSHYTLRHYNSCDSSLRDWTFEGSNDANVWFVLYEHILDQSLKTTGDTATFQVNSTNYFSHFRIIMNATNNNGRWNLACSGFEIYGKAFHTNSNSKLFKNL